jgi:hypothetical protein
MDMLLDKEKWGFYSDLDIKFESVHCVVGALCQTEWLLPLKSEKEFIWSFLSRVLSKFTLILWTILCKRNLESMVKQFM